MTSSRVAIHRPEDQTNSLRSCQQEDVLLAFMAVVKEVRSRIQHFGRRAMTQREACELAGRIKEQRNLLRQIVSETQREKIKRLLYINRRLRNKVVTIAQAANLDTSAMTLK